MQRSVAFLVLAAVSLLAGLRLAAAAQDTEAMRCAIACGHAPAAEKGASCCPMAKAPGAGPSFKTCGQGDGLALIPLAPGQLAVLASVAPLNAPQADRHLDAAPDSDPRSGTPRPLDHVPLLFG